jgi:hypothetical protein
MTVRWEIVTDVRMRVSKICEGCFRELVKTLYLVYFIWLYF